MGMTREEFSILAKGMKAVYGEKFLPDKYAFDVWYRLLCDLSYESCNIAVQTYMMTEKFSPVPADIRKYASRQSMETLTESEAWNMVRKACQSLSWDKPEDEFNKLPQVVQRAVVSPQALAEMAKSDLGEFETVIASNFMRTFKAVSKQHEQEAQIPQEVRIKIEQMKNKALGLEVNS